MVTQETPISELTVAELSELLKGSPSPVSERYLTTPEAAAYIRKSPHALRVMVCRKRIPSIKGGNSLYFLKKDLDAWMMSRMRPIEGGNAEDILKIKGGSRK